MLRCQGQDWAKEVKLSPKKIEENSINLTISLSHKEFVKKKEMEVWGFVTGKPRPLQTKS